MGKTMAAAVAIDRLRNLSATIPKTHTHTHTHTLHPLYTEIHKHQKTHTHKHTHNVIYIYRPFEPINV